MLQERASFFVGFVQEDVALVETVFWLKVHPTRDSLRQTYCRHTVWLTVVFFFACPPLPPITLFLCCKRKALPRRERRKRRSFAISTCCRRQSACIRQTNLQLRWSFPRTSSYLENKTTWNFSATAGNETWAAIQSLSGESLLLFLSLSLPCRLALEYWLFDLGVSSLLSSLALQFHPAERRVPSL